MGVLDYVARMDVAVAQDDGKTLRERAISLPPIRSPGYFGRLADLVPIHPFNFLPGLPLDAWVECTAKIQETWYDRVSEFNNFIFIENVLFFIIPFEICDGTLAGPQAFMQFDQLFETLEILTQDNRLGLDQEFRVLFGETGKYSHGISGFNP